MSNLLIYFNFILKKKKTHIKLFPKDYYGPTVTNPWVELTLRNWLAKGEYPRAYKHIVNLTLKM